MSFAMHPTDRRVYLGAGALAVTGLTAVCVLAAGRERALTPQIMSVSPTTFTETKATGERIIHPIIHAVVRAPAGTGVPDLAGFARNAFDRTLRAQAEAQLRQMVWITFYLADPPERPTGAIKTYREIYVLDGRSWRRLNGTGKAV